MTKPSLRFTVNWGLYNRLQYQKQCLWILLKEGEKIEPIFKVI